MCPIKARDLHVYLSPTCFIYELCAIAIYLHKNSQQFANVLRRRAKSFPATRKKLPTALKLLQFFDIRYKTWNKKAIKILKRPACTHGTLGRDRIAIIFNCAINLFGHAQTGLFNLRSSSDIGIRKVLKV